MAAVRKKSTEASPKAKMDLDEGDMIEYSISAYIRTKGGGEAWVKAGSSTRVRSGETAQATKVRLRDTVELMLDEAAKDFT